MRGILVLGSIGVRRIGVAALLAGSALLAAASPEAAAKGGSAALRADLQLGVAGEGTAAEGDMVLKQGRRRDRLKLRLRNLEPRTKYDVVDGATGDVLRTVRSNRRGGARTSIRSAPPARDGRAAPESGLPGALEGMDIEVRRSGEDDPVLEGEVPGDEERGPTYAYGSVSTEPDAEIQVSISMTSWSDPSMDRPYESIALSVSPGFVWIAGGMDPGLGGNGMVFPDVYPPPELPELPNIPGPVTFWIADGDGNLEKVATVEASDFGLPVPMMEPGGFPDGTAFPVRDDGTDGGNDGGGDGGGGGGDDLPSPSFYFWWADNTTEEGLPFGVERVGDLSGRAFEVRDGEGTVLLEGVLPGMEEIDLGPMPEPEPLPEPLPCPDIRDLLDLFGGIVLDFHIDFGTGEWSFTTGGSETR